MPEPSRVDASRKLIGRNVDNSLPQPAQSRSPAPLVVHIPCAQIRISPAPSFQHTLLLPSLQIRAKPSSRRASRLLIFWVCTTRRALDVNGMSSGWVVRRQRVGLTRAQTDILAMLRHKHASSGHRARSAPARGLLRLLIQPARRAAAHSAIAALSEARRAMRAADLRPRAQQHGRDAGDVNGAPRPRADSPVHSRAKRSGHNLRAYHCCRL
ncbi:hypothetical protein BC834DRAFT_305375 [Gloeopeniophorella convolvens]|nr:hypothetical protein BC834DRAFT_305375 [Gloeopeniophorella convolvens]